MESVQWKTVYHHLNKANRMTSTETGKWHKSQNAYAGKEKTTLQNEGMESCQHTWVFVCVCTPGRVSARVSLMPYFGPHDGSEASGSNGLNPIWTISFSFKNIPKFCDWLHCLLNQRQTIINEDWRISILSLFIVREG